MVKKIDDFDMMSISERSPIGYLLEVYLKYSDELHELQDYMLFIVIRCQIIAKKLLINMR